jgi:hypothetical protein
MIHKLKLWIWWYALPYVPAKYLKWRGDRMCKKGDHMIVGSTNSDRIWCARCKKRKGI